MREGTTRSLRTLWTAGVAAGLATGLGALLVAPGAGLAQAGAEAGEAVDPPADHGAPEWGYDCADGPPFLWGERFPLCGEGEAQSPIDVSTTGSVWERLAPLEPEYGTADVEVVNNGHTIEVEVPEGKAVLRVGGQAYRLVQFHWHTPSEHWLDGERYPMELHMVHAGQAGRMVVGALIEEGEANRELAKIWAVLPERPGDHAAVADFAVWKLLPEHSSSSRLTSYRYSGSLTTPPCDEGISWALLAEPVTLSTEQIGAFRALFFGTEGFPAGNARPLQPRNGRIVRTDAGRP